MPLYHNGSNKWNPMDRGAASGVLRPGLFIAGQRHLAAGAGRPACCSESRAGPSLAAGSAQAWHTGDVRGAEVLRAPSRGRSSVG